MDGPRCRFALDFGASSLIALAQQGIEHNSIDAVLLTHLHGDHAAGVPFLLMDAMPVARRARPLTIAGPRELRVRMDAIREALLPGSHVMTPRFPADWIEMEPGRPHPVLDLLVTPERARHTEETNPTALRIQVGDKVICYTGDTEWTDEVARAAQNTDHRSRRPSGRPAADPHSHEPRDAGARGRRAGAVRLRRPGGHPVGESA